MNKRRTDNWTAIEIPGDDTGNDTKAFELNLDGDEPNETVAPPNNEEVLDVREEVQDNRRQIITVPKNSQNQNRQARTEVEEAEEERTVPRRQARQPQVVEEEVDAEEDNKRNSRAHKRIQTLHRRATEAETELARERAEKLELRRQLAATQRRSAETSRDSYKTQLDSAEAELEAAVQSNDAARIAKATRAMSALTIRHEAMQAVTEEPEQEIVEEAPRQPQQDLTAAKSWLERNPKFKTDRTFHVNARLISEDLTKEGTLDPQDDEYWEEMDKRLRKTLRTEQEPVQQESQAPVRRRSSPVGSRNEEDSEPMQQFKPVGKGRISVTPTADDYEIAEKFNLKIEDLMAEKYKYAQVGNKGYVQIDIPGQK